MMCLQGRLVPLGRMVVQVTVVTLVRLVLKVLQEALGGLDVRDPLENLAPVDPLVDQVQTDLVDLMDRKDLPEVLDLRVGLAHRVSLDRLGPEVRKVSRGHRATRELLDYKELLGQVDQLVRQVQLVIMVNLVHLDPRDALVRKVHSRALLDFKVLQCWLCCVVC